MMTIHLHREIDHLKQLLLKLSANVEESVYLSVVALTERDEELAQKVIDADSEIDLMEVEVEEECLKALALHQPVAVDLRFIVSVLKINNDLERIGDQAVNIAESAIVLAEKYPQPIPYDLSGMAKKTQAMLKKSLDSLVNADATRARQVCEADDEVDDMLKGMFRDFIQMVDTDTSKTDFLLRLLSAARQLERIADLATNIAEDVIYLVSGEIVRHRMFGLGLHD